MFLEHYILKFIQNLFQFNSIQFNYFDLIKLIFRHPVATLIINFTAILGSIIDPDFQLTAIPFSMEVCETSQLFAS